MGSLLSVNLYSKCVICERKLPIDFPSLVCVDCERRINEAQVWKDDESKRVNMDSPRVDGENKVRVRAVADGSDE
jgi:hypothetical protein